MHFSSTTSVDGINEHLFTVGDVHGVLWTPDTARDDRPLVLLGHGGGQHKKAPAIRARATRYVSTCDFAAVAIDAPGHGDRPRTAQDEERFSRIRQRMAAGEPVGPEIAANNAELASRAVPEWRTVLDGLHEAGHLNGPVGYWGVSLGSAIGVPLVAEEARIGAAVLGLVAHEAVGAAAPRITIPVEFLLQWDDEFVPRQSGLALFDALGSEEKTLHANPGRHIDVPMFEVDSSTRFFQRHLTR